MDGSDADSSSASAPVPSGELSSTMRMSIDVTARVRLIISARVDDSLNVGMMTSASVTSSFSGDNPQPEWYEASDNEG